jgi:hypothetical protein
MNEWIHKAGRMPIDNNTVIGTEEWPLLGYNIFMRQRRARLTTCWKCYDWLLCLWTIAVLLLCAVLDRTICEGALGFRLGFVDMQVATVNVFTKSIMIMLYSVCLYSLALIVYIDFITCPVITWKYVIQDPCWSPRFLPS